METNQKEQAVTARPQTREEALEKALQRHLSIREPGHPDRPVKAVTCADGMTVSIQGHYGAYSVPRHHVGPWSAVELGFPSERPNETIMRRAENPEQPTDTVYGYVPMADVVAWLLEHGGCPEIEAIEAAVRP